MSTRSRGALGLGTVARRGWRSTAGLGVLLALSLVAGTAFLVGSLGAATTAFEEGIGDAVAQAPPYQRDLNLELYPDTFLDAAPQRPPGPGRPAPFAGVSQVVRAQMSPRVRHLIEEEFVSAQSDPMVVKGTGVSGRTVQAVVRLDNGFGSRVRWVAGTAPGKATRELTIDTISTAADEAVLKHRVRVIPVAMRDRTAKLWGVKVGDVLKFERTNDPDDALTDSAAFVVSGLFAPIRPQDPFWSIEPRMLGVAKVPTPQGGIIEEASVLAPISSYGDLTDSLGRAPGPDIDSVFPALHHQWRFILRHDLLRRADTRAIADLLTDLQIDPAIWPDEVGPPQVVTGLPRIFRDYDRSVRTTTVIMSFAVCGVMVLVVLILALLALVLVNRRVGEIKLIGARGGSAAQVGRLMVAGVLAWSAPALALGALAGLWVGSGRLGIVAIAGVALLEMIAVLGVAWLTRTRLRSGPDSGSSARRGVARMRRTVAEVTLVALAVAAVASVRARGRDIARGQVDWFAAVAPTLVALAAGVVLLRLLPPGLRWLAARFARGRGYIGFLGFSRASASARRSAVPLIAIVVSASLISLLASVTLTIREHRDLNAFQSTGAQARIDYTRLDADVVDRLAARPGVTAAVPAVITSAEVTSGDEAHRLTLIGVDPHKYADLLAGTPIGFTASGSSSTGPLPLLVSETSLNHGDLGLEVAGKTLPARAVAVLPRLRRVSGQEPGPVVLAPLDQLAEEVPGIQPNTAFLRLSSQAGKALSRDASLESRPLGQLATDVTVAQDLEEDLAQRPLSLLITTGYAAGFVFAILLGMLALVLLLGASRPERMSAAMQLRALGVPASAAGRMWLVEIFPVVVLAATAGALVGAVAPRVLAPALDLRPFVGGAVRPELAALPLPALLASVLVIVALSAFALILDVRWSRRASVAQSLREGDRP